jgi:hypothetical protein
MWGQNRRVHVHMHRLSANTKVWCLSQDGASKDAPYRAELISASVDYYHRLGKEMISNSAPPRLANRENKVQKEAKGAVALGWKIPSLSSRAVSIGKKIAKLVLLGAVLNWNFDRIGQLVGPPVAEVRVTAIGFSDRLDIDKGKFFSSFGLEYATRETENIAGVPVLDYRRKQSRAAAINRRNIFPYQDPQQLNWTTNSIVKLLIGEVVIPKKPRVFLAVETKEKETISREIAANPSLRDKIEFVNCPDCARTADLTIVPLCKDDDQTCFGEFRHSPVLNNKPFDPTDAQVRHYGRQFEAGIECYGDPIFMYSVNPPAGLQDAASQLAVDLAGPIGSSYWKPSKKVFSGDLPRNPNHGSFLLYSEVWFHADRCAINRRYYAGEAMPENFFSLVMPTRTGAQTGLGSVCVVSGNQKNVSDHAKIVGACIRKYLNPQVELVMEKPAVAGARSTLFGNERTWQGLQKRP